jgi:hypothetical protein
VAREAKANIDIKTGLGAVKIGGDAEPIPVEVKNEPDSPVPVDPAP